MLKINYHLNKYEYNKMESKSTSDYDINYLVEKQLMQKSKIKMEDLQRNIVPIIECDVFISYSHEDKLSII